MYPVFKKEAMTEPGNYRPVSLTWLAVVVIDCTEEWGRAMDRGVGVEVVYLDLSKAFDTVSHVRLCKKLEGLGIESHNQVDRELPIQ